MIQKKLGTSMRLLALIFLMSTVVSPQQSNDGGVKPPRIENYWRADKLSATESKALNFIEFFIEADLPVLLSAFGIIALTGALAFGLPPLMAWWLLVLRVPDRITRGVAVLTFLAVALFGLAVALSLFDLDKTSLVFNLNLLGIALSAGLGLHLSNIFSGMLMPMTSRAEIGDEIIIIGAGGQVRGEIVEIGFFNTYVRTAVSDGDNVEYVDNDIPNHYFSTYHCTRIRKSDVDKRLKIN